MTGVSKRKEQQMDALELVARREALGLDQEGLAGLLQWEVAAVVECEESRRDIPAEVAAKHDELEFARDTIAGVLEDSLPGDVRTYIDDDAFWAAWPQMRGVPAKIHRIAAAGALRSARWAGVHTRIVAAEH